MKKKYKLLTYFEFLSYFAIIGAVVISLISYSNLKSDFADKFAQEKRAESTRLTNQINEIFTYSQNYINLVATRIAEADSSDPKVVARILKDIATTISEDQNFFTWTVFDFIDPSGKVIATSNGGVMENAVYIPKEKRTWMTDAPKNPWKLHIAKSDIGIISGENIIPCGFAVTDKRNKLLGIITFGISIKKLQEKLEDTLADQITSFALLNKDHSVILSSRNFDKEDLKNGVTIEDNLNGYLDLNNKSYYHANLPENVGLSVLTGVSQDDAYIKILTELFPKIITIAYLTLLFLILLYLIRAKLLRPILDLSEIVSKISNGQLDCSIPDSKIHEISVLAKSIDTMQDFLVRERDVKSKLQEKTVKIEQVCNNKTDLISSFSIEVRDVIAGISGIAQIMKSSLRTSVSNRERSFNNIDVMNNESYLNDIIKLSSEASHLVSDVANMNAVEKGGISIVEKDVVDVQILVSDIIRLLRSKASNFGRQIYTNIDTSISSSEYIATGIDAIRTKQVVFNVLNNAIDHAFKNGAIEIIMTKLSPAQCEEINDIVKRNLVENEAIDTQKKNYLLNMLRNKKSRVSISVRDNGIGISEYKMRMIKKDYNSIKNKISGRINMIDLDISMMRYIVEFQGGLFEVDSKSGFGTVVNIIL